MSARGPVRLRRVCASIVAVAAALGTSVLAAAQPRPQDVIRAFDWLEPYLTVVAKYRAGDFESAVKATQKWDKARLATAATHLKTLAPQLAVPPAAAFQLDVADLEGAVVLFLEGGMSAFRNGDRDEGDALLDHSRTLLDLLTSRVGSTSASAVSSLPAASVSSLDVPSTTSLASRRGRIDDREWHLAAVTLLGGLREIGYAARESDEAVRRFPRDAEVRLAAGSVREELATALERESRLLLPSRAPGRAPRSITQEILVARFEAVAHFDEALQLDPSMAEAAIRRARVLTRLDRAGDARAALEALLPHLADKKLIFLAELFLGGILEDQNRLGDAALAFRRATLAVPGSQTARVALAHALERAGVTDEAREVAGSFVAMSNRSYEEDPWWVYARGQYRRGLAILDAFRLRVRNR